jgi:hypothetical protein
MPLFSLVVEHHGKSFSTQLRAENAEQAVRAFFASIYPHTKGAAFGDSSPNLAPSDVLWVTPMSGLENIWTACAGEQGSYVQLVCVQTADAVA